MGHKILVIDDDEIAVSLMKFRLMEKGYQVVTANDGEDGLRLVLDEKPDLIFLDVHLPKMNGYALFSALRNIVGCEETPVIILTANETMEEIFYAEGVKGYFVKPVKFNEIFDKIVNVLGENLK